MVLNGKKTNITMSLESWIREHEHKREIKKVSSRRVNGGALEMYLLKNSLKA